MKRDLAERIEPATIIEAGPVHAKVTGTFLRKDAVSLNNRLYPGETVERVVKRAQERIASEGGIPVQQLVRHGDADSDESTRVVGRLTRVWMDGDLARYESEIPNTAAGRDVATLVAGGFLNTVSLRAEPGTPVVERGKLGERELDVIRDFELAGIDYTLYPGIRDDARVESITVFESVDPSGLAVLTEEAPSGAAYAQDWYETVGAAADGGALQNVTITEVMREWAPIFEKSYSKKERDAIPAADFAGPHRSFPITTQADVANAARLIGHAANPEAVKKKIIAIAKRKGFTLPDSWQSSKESTMPDQRSAGSSPPALVEGMHSHAHSHETGGEYPATYTHDHPHGHEPAQLAAHDAAEAHRHEHSAEHAPRLGGAHTETAPPAPADGHTHTPIERAALAVAAAKTALREAGLKPEELSEVNRLAVSLDADTDRLLAVLGLPDADKTAAESAPRPASLTEAGRAISAANKAHLQTAHDHIAAALGMECAPGQGPGQGDSAGADDTTERRTIGQLIKLLETAQAQTAAALAAAQRPVTPASAAAAPAAPAAENLGAALATLIESQVATQKQLTTLAETLPQAAARAAAEVAWRPERKTQVVENNLDDAAGSGGDGSLRTQLKNREIPIEKRIAMATRALEANAADIQALGALGAFNDAPGPLPGN